MSRHPLLQHQLHQHLGAAEITGPLAALLREVEETYERFDAVQTAAAKPSENAPSEPPEGNSPPVSRNDRAAAVLESLRSAMRGLDITVAPPTGDGWDDILSLSNLIQEQVRLRNRAEARLRSSEQELALIVETARDYAIVAYDADGRVVRWNAGAARLLGHTAAEARDLTFGLTFNEPDRNDGIPGRLLERAREESSCSFQGMRAQKPGTEFWADSTLSFIPETPTGPQFVEITRDITFHKRAEETLRLAKESAEEAGRAKGDFLATMSHEIRTPMNGVVGFAHLLLETRLDDRQRQYAEVINRSGQSLLTIIDDILDFSKIEAGKLEIEAISYDVATVVEDTVELLSQKAREKKIELALSCDPALPQALVGDPGRVRQILMNLVGNAVKFTQTGHVIVDVGLPENLRKRHPSLPDRAFVEGHALFCVEDTGVGIPADVQPQLFNKFTQADSSTTRKFGGTGLGLAIARRLAGLMGGQMGCTSLQGIGSTFWFTLALPDAPPPAPPTPDLGPARVLVVDDNPAVLRLLCDQLGAWNIPHAAAANAAEAKTQMVRSTETGTPFDLVLVDELESRYDAAALVTDLRSKRARTNARFILMTSSAGEVAPDTLAALGFAAHLPKPVVRRSLLLSTIQRLLRDDSAAAIPQTAGGAAAARSAPKTTGSRVLVAEDSPTNQMLAVRILEELGCTVDLADNGHEAVTLASSRRYDLILMDCQMPDMDGFQAAAAIRRRENGSSSRVPIVALTANAIQGDRERCLAAGMDDHLAKPIQPDALRRLVPRPASPPSP